MFPRSFLRIFQVTGLRGWLLFIHIYLNSQTNCPKRVTGIQVRAINRTCLITLLSENVSLHSLGRHVINVSAHQKWYYLKDFASVTCTLTRYTTDKTLLIDEHLFPVYEVHPCAPIVVYYHQLSFGWPKYMKLILCHAKFIQQMMENDLLPSPTTKCQLNSFFCTCTWNSKPVQACDLLIFPDFLPFSPVPLWQGYITFYRIKYNTGPWFLVPQRGKVKSTCV